MRCPRMHHWPADSAVLSLVYPIPAHSVVGHFSFQIFGLLWRSGFEVVFPVWICPRNATLKENTSVRGSILSVVRLTTIRICSSCTLDIVYAYMFKHDSHGPAWTINGFESVYTNNSEESLDCSRK